MRTNQPNDASNDLVAPQLYRPGFKLCTSIGNVLYVSSSPFSILEGYRGGRDGERDAQEDAQDDVSRRSCSRRT